MEDEIKEEILDNPLVVHKKNDASYQEMASEVSMSSTHRDEEDADAPTLERHRFRKEKKPKRWPWVAAAFVAVCVAVLGAMYNSGYIKLDKAEIEPQTTEKVYITQPENEFKGIITVKGTYIFFEGQEVDGIQGLERQIKYLDKGTKFLIQDENADSKFLNFNVLSMLSKYEINYDITHVVSSGLMSEKELAAQQTTESTTAQATNKQ